MELGGMVESQIHQAVYALQQFDSDAAERVMETEHRVNAMEIEIDRELSSIIARRQPTARDLRLLIAISKTTANLERVGRRGQQDRTHGQVDHRERFGAHAAFQRDAHRRRPGLGPAAQGARCLRALDTAAAVSILKDDDLIDKEFDGFVRKLVTYMMEDPRTISASLDLLFLAKAIERIGDHSKNIAEFIIYVVKGADVRHTSMQEHRIRPCCKLQQALQECMRTPQSEREDESIDCRA
jgi:phosphate transport system protein